MSGRAVKLATGFGDGAQFLAARRAWMDAGVAGTLHYIVLLPTLPAEAALHPALRAALQEETAGWPVGVPGLHRLELNDGKLILDLLAGPLEATLPQVDARVDAFYLPQPIAPLRALAKLALPGATLHLHGADDAALKALRSAGFEWQPAPHSEPGPAAAEPGIGGHAGLQVEGGPAREASGSMDAPVMDVTAIFTSRKPQPPRAAGPERRAIVIGAGVAGAAACERLAARGWDVTLIERHRQPAQEASGNRAGIFMPLLSRDDNIPTRLSRAAYLYAMRHWQRLGGLDPDAAVPDTRQGYGSGAASGLGGAGTDTGIDAATTATATAAPRVARIAGAQCGVLQLARDAEHAALQKEVAAAWNYPPEFVRWVDADEAGKLLGLPTPDGGWLFSQGGWANPASICRAMLDACGTRLTRLFHTEALRLERAGGQWRVYGGSGAGGAADEDGRPLAEAPHVILANGAGALAIEQTAPLPLYTMRGQVTHLTQSDSSTEQPGPLPASRLQPQPHATRPHPDFPDLPLVVCREAYMTPPVHGIVSVGATYDSDTGGDLRQASQQENLSRARDILPGVLTREPPLAGRVGFRCMAPDRLPLVGALPDYGAAPRMERLRDVPRHAGLYGLLGYASRGLIWAPLAAELLAAQLEHEPPPLEANLAAALDPARFLLKSRRGGQV